MLGPERLLEIRLLEISHPALMVDWAAERGKDIGVKVIHMLVAEVGVETRYPQCKQSGSAQSPGLCLSPWNEGESSPWT